MVFDAIVEQAAERLPISAMVRSLLENCLNDVFVDGIFAEYRRLQYERDLLFSTIVGLLSVVVCKVYPSIHAAVVAAKERLGVSTTAIYNKLNGTDPEVSAALLKVSMLTRLLPKMSETHAESSMLRGLTPPEARFPASSMRERCREAAKH